MSSRVTAGTESGWESVILENELLRVVVLPEKGAEIYRLVDLESGIDLLFKGPWGLQPPGSPPLPGGEDDEFMWNYAGGWQELLPSVNEACTYRGRRIPFHGEVATLPWQHEVIASGDGEAAVRFWTRCVQTPFSVERTLRLSAGVPELVIEGSVSNDGAEPAHFVWGQHCVVGPPFLEAGCRLEIPARSIVTTPELWEPETARIAPRQHAEWPNAPLRAGGTVDLREVPGPETGSHDDVYVTDLESGRLTVLNPRLGLRFRLDWDPAVFGWIVVWQPYGGALAQPLTGSYALGVEPWTCDVNLEQAVAADRAIELAPGARFDTELRASVHHEAQP